MSGIRGWWKNDVWHIAGLLPGRVLTLDGPEAHALHRATPEDPDEAKAVADVLGQVAVVATMAQGLRDGPLKDAITELANLQKLAINERARVARQEGKDT